jgi:hypothetical protein
MTVSRFYGAKAGPGKGAKAAPAATAA